MKNKVEALKLKTLELTVVCDTCGGQGYYESSIRESRGGVCLSSATHPCPDCGGGEYPYNKNGTGKRTIEIECITYREVDS